LARSARTLSAWGSHEEPQEGSKQEGMPWKGARMKAGDVIKFKATGIIATILSVWPVDPGWTEVKILHNVPNIQNPTGFSLSHLMQHADVISTS
jgi:hypothetical protein